MKQRCRFLRRMGAALVVVPCSLAPVLALAQAQEEGSGQRADSLTSLVTLGLGLLAVIAIIFGCAWLVKRMNGLTGMNHQSMKIVAAMALGARERVALIDVGGTQILVGITPSSIRTLHVFDEPVVTPGEGANSEFARRLQGLMSKRGAGFPGQRRDGGGS